MKDTTSYEITFIASENQKPDEIRKVLASHEAKILDENDLGSRTLAYEIKKATAGHYFRIVFDCSHENINKIEKDLRKQDLVLRYLIVTAIRKPVETERHLPQVEVKLARPVATPAKAEVVAVKAPEAKAEIKEDTIVKSVVSEEKPEAAPKIEKIEVKKEEKKAEKTLEKPVEDKKPRRVIKKATKAEASELDKKLEELTKED